jgi:hypothetical protein
MTRSTLRDSQANARQAVADAVAGHGSAEAPPSLPARFAATFSRLGLGERAHVLWHLLRQVGPMALLVVGGGAFAKFAGRTHSTQPAVSLEDAAGIGTRQIVELIHYLEQSNPELPQQLLNALAGNAAAMTAIGAAVAGFATQHAARAGTEQTRNVRRGTR